MKFRCFRSSLSLLLLIWLSVAMRADDLKPGSPAPALQIREWLKGEPIERLENQGTYVVEFWATWCGPCIESIPHVSELAKKHSDIVFLGVSVLEEPMDDHIKAFVETMGEKMAYRVAYSGNQDGMATTWLKPAMQDGIPTAFLIQGGVIQWIGHPVELDIVLEQLSAGTFDLEASKRAFEAQLEATKARMAANAALTDVVALRDKGQKDEALQALTQAVATYPRLAMASERLRYEWLAEDDPQEWLKQTNRLAETRKPDNLQQIASFALRSTQKPETADRARQAIAIALRACERRDWDVLMYARTIYLKLSDVDDALAATNRMLELQPDSPAKDNVQLKEALLKSRTELEAKSKGP